MKRSLTFLCFMCFAMCLGQIQQNVTVRKTFELMGSSFDITVVVLNDELGYIHIDEAVAEITRIDKLLSNLYEDSETSLINNNAGIAPVKVSAEVFTLIQRANQISELTNGVFDISYASLNEVWKFDGTMDKLPSESQIVNSISKINYKDIILNEKDQTVFLKNKGMRIAFNAIAKGYAVDKAKELLVSKSIAAGVINGSGDISTWGTKINGEKWMIGIANPKSTSKIFTWLPVVESSVATSVFYEKFVMFDNQMYAHIIDPRTGYPASGVFSVSIFAKSAELADALSTAVFILGAEKGIALIDQLGATEVVLVDSENTVHKSSGILLEVTN